MAEVSPSKEMRDMELAETDVAAGRGKIIEKATAFPMREIRGIMARIISLCMGIGNDWFVPGGWGRENL